MLLADIAGFIHIMNVFYVTHRTCLKLFLEMNGVILQKTIF